MDERIRRWAFGALTLALVLALALAGKTQAQEKAAEKDAEKAAEKPTEKTPDKSGEKAPEDPAHGELRALRDEAVAAFEKRDIDKLLACLHPNVVVIPQNAEVLRGHDAVKAFHKRMSEGDAKTVQSQKTDFTVDELSILYGDDTAVAFGTLKDQFKLSNGMEFNLTSKWNATVVKADGKWKVASFDATTNMFDNGVSNLMLKWNTLKSGGVGLLLGGVVVGAIALFTRRKA